MDRKKRYSKKIKKQKLNEFVEKCSNFENENTENQLTDSSIYSESVDSDFNLNNLTNSNSEHDNASICNEDNYNVSSDEFVYDPADVREIRELQAWVVSNNVPHDNVDGLLKILRRRLLPSLPKCAKTFLKCDVDLTNIEKMTVANGSKGEFKYFGLKDQLLKKVDVRHHNTQILEIIVNIDGMSPFKSSSITVWPILGKVFTYPDLYEPFTIAVYCGKGKPKSCSEFLEKFIRELNQVLQDGIVIQQKLFEVKIKFFVCDSPARSFIKCIVGHVAFHGCERCKVIGKKVDGVTVFLENNAKKRTDLSFKEFEDPECHTGVSPLCAVKPPLNLVSQFILDPMHLLYLGCTKRILEYLLSTSSHKVRLSATMKAELTRRTMMIKKDIPDEFPRKMRSTEEWSKYKAVELKFFSLYAAAIVLKKLVPEEIYNHFLLFTVASRLLSDKNRNINIAEARKYYTTFVEQASTLYGSTFVSLNIHNLIHVSDDVEKTGCSLSDLSAFPFESYLGSVSSVIRSANNIVAQYCRRLEEKDKFLKKEITIPPELEILMKKKNQIIKIKYKGFTLSINHPNNTILLKSGIVAVISKFNYNDCYVINNIEVRKYTKKESVFEYPCNSIQLNICEISKLADQIMCVSLEAIEKKLVKLQLNFSTEERERLYVVPLLH